MPIFDFLPQILIGTGIAVGLMIVLWIVQWLRTDAGWVDVGWTASMGLLAIWFAATTNAEPARRCVIGAAAAIWAFRLGFYLLFNRVIGHRQEDGRYQNLRRHWGSAAQFNFFWFFQAQAILAVLFALAFYAAISAPRSPAGWNVFDWIGLAIWLTAVVGESTADAQLAAFRAKPENRGKTCRVGLWRYSRHPNYFFEWTHWLSYVFWSVGHPFGALTLLAPAAMLFFLFRVTGIPHTERQAVASRGDDYRAYQRTTSAFFPWWPKPDVQPPPNVQSAPVQDAAKT